MITDYRIVAFQGASSLRRVDLLDNAVVPTLDITGVLFKDVARVLVNDVPCVDFIVLSQSRILAQIPTTQLSSPIRTVRVLSFKDDISQTTAIFFEAYTGSRVAEGWVRVIQLFLKLLLTKPGSDIFTPTAGGGLYESIGNSTSIPDIKAAAALSISNTQTQMIQFQAEDSRLTSQEKLKAATLLGAEFDSGSGKLSLRIRLTAVDGTTSDVNTTI